MRNGCEINKDGFNSTVNLLKTKKEELEHVKKNKVVLLERASRAYARERRALQRALDEEEGFYFTSSLNLAKV